MAAVFESILHMSAVGSIVIFTVVIVRFFLKNAPKFYSYLLWAIVLLRLLCPFTVESPLSTIPGELPFDSAVEELSDTHAYPSFTEPAINHTGESTNNELGEMYRPNSGDSHENVPAGSTPPAPAAKTDSLHILSIIWLCGVGVMAAWSIAGYIKLKRRLRGAMACENNVYLSYKVGTPFVLGIFRPKIYLPANISGEEWDYIVLHERCHIRRGDHITRVLAFAALAIHWFNPLVWLAFILSGRDMEMSCDESVLRSLGPQVRKAYSTSLLSLATGRPILSGMPLAFGEGDPKGRIRNLAKWRKPTLAMIIAAVLVCIVAAVCLLTDPVSPKAQINVYGSIYTYSGKEKKLPAEPGLIYLGILEGVTHNSSEPPTDTLHGTNLDPKYAGQDMLLPDIRSLYLYDEEGFYLVFELDKDSERPKIPESPRTEVARGDFDRDGREDYIEVSKADPYSEALRIRLVDAETDMVLWTESTSVAEDEQKAFIHRIGEDGLDYIIIDSYDPAEEWYYSRTIYINDGREKVVERREGELKLPQAESDEEFALYMSSSLPKNSIVMLSTLGGRTILGPLKSPERPAPESIEVFSGDFDHDGEDEVAVVMPDPMHGGQLWNLYLMNPDGSIAWSEEGFATAHAGHNCILAYEDADGLDYLVRYNPYMNQGIASYRCQQFYIDNSNIRNYTEVVHQEWLLEFKDATGETAEMKEFATAMEALLGRSYVLLSTLNFELQIGPIRGDAAGLLPVSFGLEAEGKAWEDFCKAHFSAMMQENIAHYTWEMYVDGVMGSGTPRNEAWFYGDDWLHRSEMVTEDGTYIQTTLEKDGVQYLWSCNPNGQQILSSDSGEFGGYGRRALDSWLGYEMSFVSKTETDKTTELVFEVFADEGNPNNARISYMFDQRMRLSEARFESDIPHTDENGQVTRHRQCIVIAFPKVSEPMCRDTIKEAYETIMAEAQISGFDNVETGIAQSEDTIIDDGSSYPLAVPYGVSVVTDLDGDGVTETICQKVNESGYRIESITVNGVEYLDKVLELCLPYPNNAEADSIPCWYITDILSGDGKKEITFYDGGPSADPVTFFFDYDKGELKYLGNVPYYSDCISYGGDGYFTSPARLAVFQTWFAEHTWSIFGLGGTVQSEPRDFYYVDFRFRDYTIGDEYFPGSDTSPLLREVRVYEEMDLSSEKGRLPIGTEISILGTDNIEWLLISDGSREYYLHINGPTIQAAGGNYLEAQKVLNGLHYYG